MLNMGYLAFCCVLILALQLAAGSFNCRTPSPSLIGYGGKCRHESDCVTFTCKSGSCGCPSNMYYNNCTATCVPRFNTTIYSGSGYLVSPNYPNNYSDNVFYTWTFCGPQTSNIITFGLFETYFENHTSCGYDYIAVYDGGSNSSLLLYKDCSRNNTSYRAFTSTGNYMHIVFKTDGSQQHRGFIGSYYIKDITKTLTAPYGTIVSPNYPGNYDDSVFRYWLIQGQPNSYITFSLHETDFEYITPCVYDYVALYDGETNSSPIINKTCNKNDSTPRTFASTRNTMYIVFKTDSSGRYRGFLGYYHIRSYNSTITQMIGTVANPGFPQKYPNSSYYSWTLDGVNEVVTVRLFIQMQGFPDCKDAVLRVYDGGNTNAKLISQYCQSNFSANLTSTTSLMHIVFKTNSSSLVYPGFNASFVVKGRPKGSTCSSDSDCNPLLTCVNGTCGCSSDRFYNASLGTCDKLLSHGGKCLPHVSRICERLEFVCKPDVTHTLRCLCEDFMFYDGAQCLPISDLQVTFSNSTQILSNEVKLTWATQTLAVNVTYNLTWVASNDILETGNVMATSDGANVTGLKPGQTYNFTVLTILGQDFFYGQTIFKTEITIQTEAKEINIILIVGITIGVLVAVCLVSVVIIVVRRHRKSHDKSINGTWISQSSGMKLLGNNENRRENPGNVYNPMALTSPARENSRGSPNSQIQSEIVDEPVYVENNSQEDIYMNNMALQTRDNPSDGEVNDELYVNTDVFNDVSTDLVANEEIYENHCSIGHRDTDVTTDEDTIYGNVF